MIRHKIQTRSRAEESWGRTVSSFLLSQQVLGWYLRYLRNLEARWGPNVTLYLLSRERTYLRSAGSLEIQISIIYFEKLDLESCIHGWEESLECKYFLKWRHWMHIALYDADRLFVPEAKGTCLNDENATIKVKSTLRSYLIYLENVVNWFSNYVTPVTEIPNKTSSAKEQQKRRIKRKTVFSKNAFPNRGLSINSCQPTKSESGDSHERQIRGKTIFDYI